MFQFWIKLFGPKDNGKVYGKHCSFIGGEKTLIWQFLENNPDSINEKLCIGKPVK